MSKDFKKILVGGLIFGISNSVLCLTNHYDLICNIVTVIVTLIIISIDMEIDRK